MPTTILDGETFEEARERRFAEEALVDEKILARANKELLEQAAKAAGIELYWDQGVTPVNSWAGTEWNPLHNDGLALRLAVKLGLEISCGDECRYLEEITYFKTTSVSYYDVVTGREYECDERHNDDPYAATRRAIVRAAAEIAKSMK